MIPSKHLGRLLRPGMLLLPLLLSGCNAAILNPKGQIGQDEKTLLITSVVLMLLVVIPVIVMTLVFAWKYRASNTRARYEPNWSHSTAIEVVVWAIPCMIILVLAVLTWRSSHALDPYKPLDSDVKPVKIEAISMDWKWLFIYPDEGIATVNEIYFPVDTPVAFRITSDTVMNAFFIPQLGTQIYSMAGMTTQLHLIANEAGVYDGISSNYAGHGFSKMSFKAHAVPDKAAFDAWVAKVKASTESLNADSFKALEDDKNVENVYPVTYFSSVPDHMFDSVVGKFMMGPNHQGHGEEHAADEHAAMHDEGASAAMDMAAPATSNSGDK